MRVLLVGDVFGRPGLAAVQTLLPALRRELRVDLAVVNGENVANGFGMTAELVDALRAAGADVVTSGNHVWDAPEMLTYLTDHPARAVLRPLNYPPEAPGEGVWLGENVLVINVMGRLFMRALDCPFRAVDAALERYGARARVRIVDFHAEATSEKIALAWYLDGRVSAVLGTHTHVPTADARILPGGTAALTDVGMTGPYNSVIGVEPAVMVRSFLTALPQRPRVARGPLVQLNAALVDIDEASGRARSIERVDRIIEIPDEVVPRA